jgi:hypothetical protein
MCKRNELRHYRSPLISIVFYCKLALIHIGSLLSLLLELQLIFFKTFINAISKRGNF